MVLLHVYEVSYDQVLSIRVARSDCTGVQYEFLKIGNEYAVIREEFIAIRKSKSKKLITLKSRAFEKLFCKLSKVKIPPVSKTYQNTTLDGQEYTVRITQNGVSFEISWDNEGPKEWKPMTEIIKRMIDLVETE